MNTDIPMDFMFFNVPQHFGIEFSLYDCFVTSAIVKLDKNIALLPIANNYSE